MHRPVVQVPELDPFDDAPTQVVEEGEIAGERSAWTRARPPGAAVATPTPALETLGHYRLLRPLAQGGMGLVYEAIHVHLGRRVAIKRIRPGLDAGPELIRRFLGEAIAATRVGHPGVVGVYDYGYAPDGNAYLAMELLEGESLADRIAAGSLPLAEILAIGREIAEAMAAAHDAGIVHRDLKPDNVFLARDRGAARGVRAKVLDFGVAKSVTGALVSALRTSMGHIVGTPLYMSPEQAVGSERIDERSDIYALGCVLYHMACRRPPFVGDAVDVLVAHRTSPAVPPRKFDSTLPASLDALLSRMLEKDPDRRPRSMAEVAAELLAIARPAAEPLAVLPRRVAPRGRPTLAPTVLSARSGDRAPGRLSPLPAALFLAGLAALAVYLA